MGTILSVYSKSAYKEYILPAGEDMDYSLLLSRRIFDMEKDLKLEFEALSGQWYILRTDDYKIVGEDEKERYKLVSYKVIQLSDAQNNGYRLISRNVQRTYNDFTKYSISDESRITVGRAPDNDICYDNLGLVSKHHAMIERNGNNWYLINTGKNGIYVNSRRVLDSCLMNYGDLVDIVGLRILFLGDHIAVGDSGDNTVVDPGLTIYRRETENPEIRADYTDDILEEPGVLTGMAAGTEADLLPDRSEIVIEQPVIGVSRWKDTYNDYLDIEEKKIRELYESNRSKLTAAFPSSSDIVKESRVVQGLWERGLKDEDLMRFRIGTGTIKNPSGISVDEGKLYLTDRKLYERVKKIKECYSYMSDVPFALDLDGHNSLYISGTDRSAGILAAEALSVQMAHHISPALLKMAFVFNSSCDEETELSHARWLPHVWSEDMSCRYFSRSREDAGETVYRLTRVLLSREELTDDEIRSLPRYAVFVTDISFISGTLLEKYIMQERYLGFTVICVDSEISRMTGYGRKDLIIMTDDKSSYVLTGSGAIDRSAFTPDVFDHSLYDSYIRKLASLKSDRTSAIAIIPDFVSLFDTLGIENASEVRIKEKWAKNRTYDHIMGVLGIGPGNIVRTLDLHERYNGPHALIAGTTGSGKSELLQSFIVSLSLEYSPEDLNFILIDFKGGGMSNRLADLPHVSGCITNFSGSETERAMLAVKNEMLNRQRTLNDYSVNHIDDYVRLFKNGIVKTPMPHIVIVIDEYAELRKEKPEVMRDLISVAQTGRSLGIHLLLATQRPRGNVDDNIRSNMRSAICFRVQDRKDSIDVLDRPDAAYLTGAGRGFFELGADEIFEPFQAAFSGRSRLSGRAEDKTVLLTDDGKADVLSSFEGAADSKSISQLDDLKGAIKEAASSCNVRAEKLWLSQLPKEITSDEVRKSRDKEITGDGRMICEIGMVDDPEQRRQYPLALDFPSSGNTAIVGMPSSGKSTAVGTVLASLEEYAPGSLMIYGIDLDSGVMGRSNGSPLVRRIVSSHDALDIEDMLDELESVAAERKNSEQAGIPCFVLIDSYEDFRNLAGHKCEVRLAELLRGAAGVNMFFVISGGGFGLGQIPGNIERYLSTVLSLEQRNKYEYMDALRTADINVIPEENIKGRGLTMIQGRVLEFQIALQG